MSASTSLIQNFRIRMKFRIWQHIAGLIFSSSSTMQTLLNKGMEAFQEFYFIIF